VTAVVRISAVVADVVLTVGVCTVLAADFQHKSLPRGFKSAVLICALWRPAEAAGRSSAAGRTMAVGVTETSCLVVGMDTHQMERR
jgi:hypothetical protein